MTIIAAADGSALGNPGPAGWAWYVDAETWDAGGWPHGTNNMGELTAVLELLRASAHLDDDLIIYCDSKYVINSVTQWMAGWKAKGWKKKDGKPVLNVEIMQAIDAAMQGRRVRFEWVKGHSGHPLNEAADKLANGAAVAWQAGGPPDPGPAFGHSPARSNVASAEQLSAPDTPSPTSEERVEDDLFSLFDDAADTNPTTDGRSDPDRDFAQVIAAERALLTDAVRSDSAEVAALLASDWSEIGGSGRLWTRDEVLAEIGPIATTTLEVIETRRVADDLVLLVWRATSDEGSRLRSSWWRRSGGRWIQFFAQGTPEAGA